MIIMKKTYILPLVLFLFSVIVRTPYLLNTGEMFDEFAVAGFGRVYIGGLGNLDFSKKFWSINYEHPPVAKYIYGMAVFVEEKIPFIQKTFDTNYHPDKRYFLARLVSVLIGSFTVFFVYLIGREFFSKKVGIFASLFLALMPHFIAHNTIAGLETPQAFFATMLVYFYLKGIKRFDQKYLFASFVSFALLFGTKFSGIFYVLFYIGTLLILFRKKVLSKKIILIHLKGALVFTIVFYLIWPWLWHNPLNLLESFRYFRNAHSGEYFMGSLGQPKWYYYFAYFIATTPPLILVLFFIPIFVKRKGRSTVKVLYLWFLVPFTASFIGLKQDGIRYVFSYVPALALISGIGLDLILEKYKTILQKMLIISIVFVSIAWSLVRFFPYYLDYYNVLVGGVKGVYNRKTFDYDWWGEGIRQGVDYVNKNYSDVSVYAFLRPAHTVPLFKNGLDIRKSFDITDKPHVILVSTYFEYYSYDLSFLDGYDIVEKIGVDENPLVQIYEITR